MSNVPKHVLLVEDNAHLAELLLDLLALGNYQATHANTGRRGVELAIDQQPDLIILDIRLPDMTGYEVYKEIRTTNWGQRANIIVLTASESIERIASTIDLPTERILFKPEWSMTDLLEYINANLAAQ